MKLSHQPARRLGRKSYKALVLRGLFCAGILFGFAAIAAEEGTGSGVWSDDLDRRLAQLGPFAFHPNLLPVILRNADMIGLSTAQVAELKAWRREHGRPMLELMQQVAEARIRFQTAALASTTSAETLRAFQDRIFALQRKVLDYKLACRANITGTFTEENWGNFYLVLATEGINVPLPAYGEVVATLPGDR